MADENVDDLKLGLTCMEKKQFDQAEEHFSKVVCGWDDKTKGKRAIAHRYLGILKANKPQGYLSAIDQWVQALNLDPNDSDSKNLIVMTAQRNGVSMDRVSRIFSDYGMSMSNFL